jgi:hypothetical protein
MPAPIFTFSLRSTAQTFTPFLRPNKYPHSIDICLGEMTMDIPFVVGSALLWAVTALLVLGFARLDQPVNWQP